MKVLVPTDFSKESEKALDFAGKFSNEIVLIHVLEESMLEKLYPYYSTPEIDFKKFVEERKQNAEKELEKYDVMKKLIRTGKCWEEIVKAGEDEDVDLIVIAGRGAGKLEEVTEVLIGSCAERVVRHSRKPVLVVR